MAKPRRKHPGFDVAEGSPQGEAFVSILMSFLGEEVWWKALEQTTDGSIIFLIGGSRGQGILVEGPDHADGDRWVHRWGFRYEPDGTGVTVQMEYTAHRWDPWLHAELSGDRALVDGPAGRRYRVQEQKAWETGQERDRLQMTVLPSEASTFTVCGIAVDQIDDALRRYAEKDGEGAREVGMIHQAGETQEEALLRGGDFPLVD